MTRVRALLFLSLFIFPHLFFSNANAQTYTLDWGASFSSPWTSGALTRTANNIGGSGINCTVTFAIVGSGIFVSPYPQVNNNNANSGDFEVQGSTDAIEVDIDLANRTSYVTATFAFSKPVRQLSFGISDIDRPGGTATTYGYVDEIVVTATGSSGSVAPVLSKYNAASTLFNIVANIATANTGTGGGTASSLNQGTPDQNGTMFVNFANPVTNVIVRYGVLNTAATNTNPALQAIGIGNLQFASTVTASGTVFNDANGNLVQDGGEAVVNGTNAGGGVVTGGILYANLIDAANTVIETSPVQMNGTYAFTAVPASTNNLTIQLSLNAGVVGAAKPATVLPANWVSTGENKNGQGGPADATANGEIILNTVLANITAQNFGIERLPNSGTSIQPNQGNPGANNKVTIPASAFTGTDPEGTVSAIRIMSFPANTTTLTINSIDYTSAIWPGTGVSIPTNASGNPTQLIAVNPVDGNVSVVISYAASDNAGKLDLTPGSVTIPFSVVGISGIIFNDANGNLIQDGTETVINGTNAGGGLRTGATLYANLIDAAGNVITSSNVQTNGTYSFANGPALTNGLRVQLNTVQGLAGNAKPAFVVPNGWVVVGENKNGQGGAADALPDGEIILTTASAGISAQSFAIERPPFSDTQSYNIPGQTVNTVLTLNGSGSNDSPAELSGSDPDDGQLNSGANLIITQVPANAELYYDFGAGAVLLANNAVVNNYNPANLTLRLTTPGSTIVSFLYAFNDAAGKQDPSPATYTITMAAPLPVSLLRFDGKLVSQNTLLTWTTGQELNVDRYEIEHSVNGQSFAKIGTVQAGDNSSVRKDYSFIHQEPSQGTNYYRLKMIDNDASFKYSKVIVLNNDATSDGNVNIYPNPFVNYFETVLHSPVNGKVEISLFNAAGTRLRIEAVTVVRGTNLIRMEKLNGLMSGTYFVEIKGATILIRQTLVKR